MSKSLIKLIDISLIPAATMILGKVIGLIVVNNVFNLNWGIVTDPNNFFSVKIAYPTFEEQQIATSYSNLIMFILLLCGFSFILYRALFLSSSRVTPRMIARLASHNLLNLIENAFEIYYTASIWIVMLWLSCAVLNINVLIGKAYAWTGTISFIATLIATVILLRDVASEVNLAKGKLKRVYFSQNLKV